MLYSDKDISLQRELRICHYGSMNFGWLPEAVLLAPDYPIVRMCRSITYANKFACDLGDVRQCPEY